MNNGPNTWTTITDFSNSSRSRINDYNYMSNLKSKMGFQFEQQDEFLDICPIS